jgi:sugar phosphate isomerase/epimerase
VASIPAISVSTVAYDGYGLARACESLARLGATHVEPAFVASFDSKGIAPDFSQADAATTASVIAESGLACQAMTMTFDLGALRAAPAMLKRMEFARRAGARVVNVLAPPRRRERAFLANIEEIVRQAGSLGVRLGLENPGDGIASVMDAAADAASLVERFGSDGVGVNFDLGNRATHAPDRDPVRDAVEALPHCINVHLKDLRRTSQGWFFAAIGQGEIDCAGLLEAIRARASPPPVTIELPLRLHRRPDATLSRARYRAPLADIEAAIDVSLRYVRQHLGPTPSPRVLA